MKGLEIAINIIQFTDFPTDATKITDQPPKIEDFGMLVRPIFQRMNKYFQHLFEMFPILGVKPIINQHQKLVFMLKMSKFPLTDEINPFYEHKQRHYFLHIQIN